MLVDGDSQFRSGYLTVLVNHIAARAFTLNSVPDTCYPNGTVKASFTIPSQFRSGYLTLAYSFKSIDLHKLSIPFRILGVSFLAIFQGIALSQFRSGYLLVSGRS